MKRIGLLFWVAALLTVPRLLSAAPKDVKLPPYQEYTLENGLKIFIVETREVPLVTMRLLIPAGSAQDISGREGIANLTANTLMKGAAGLGAEEISEAIEGVGGSLQVGSGRDATYVNGSFMARDFSRGLDFLAKVVIKPDFPEEEFTREKGIVKAELLSVKEEPSALASREFVRRLLGEHPYRNPVDGYPGSVESITRDDLVRFHRDFYRPRGSVLAIVGDIKAGKVLPQVKKKLGSWKDGGTDVSSPGRVTAVQFPGRKLVVIDKPDATQSQIRIGNIGVSRKTPDHFPLLVANNILGGGFTSRLMNEIRVNRGLSYTARSRMQRYLQGGYFSVLTFTKNETLRETIDVALAELDRIRTEKVGTEELEGAKMYLSGLFPFDLETNDDLAEWFTDLSFYGLDKDVVEKYRSEIDKITSEDVQRVANKYFHAGDNFILVLTNYQETAGQLEGLGPVEVITVDEVR
ncbi:MAG: insulinase family protein [Candidatus Krumholzibacteriota bacterium]|nr:insulinase family protein [Candidatus Krumholzibacteriota bacterium]